MPGIRKVALELAASALRAGPGSPPKHVVPSALKLILTGADSFCMSAGRAQTWLLQSSDQSWQLSGNSF